MKYEYVMLVVLAVLLLAAVIKIILYKRNLRALTREFRQFLSEEGNGELHLGSPDSDVEGFLEVFNSFLERTKENQLEVKQKEQELKAEIANISHDLRTPLTSMKGYLRLLRETETTEEERREYLSVVERKTGQLQYLVEQLYEYTSLKDKQGSLSLEPIELYGFLGNQLLNYYHDFEEKHIQVQLSEEKKYEILADRQALERIFGNLIGNVLKYGQEYFRIEFQEEDKRIKVVFRNPAGGLTEEEVSHLFERFYVQEKSRTQRSSGLGLPIARTLTESMGGEMTAELEEGCLVITIVFPGSIF